MATNPKPSQYDQILEDMIKEVEERVFNHIAQLQDAFESVNEELTTMKRVCANLDEDTKTLIWLRAEELYMLKEYSKKNRAMVRAAFAKQSNGSTTKSTQQPTRTSSGDTNVEIENLPKGQGVKCKRPGCDNYHRNAEQVKACFATHYAAKV